ncbi:MAG: type VI secretion system tube protein Hcp [Deltaproteobacteria bacterium]|nr:type VI secretion system tube protein Hcp [Deltaproteobacteria bacterium]
MAFDAFLKIDGIDGESTDDAHADWIEVLSYSTGVSQTASGSASSGGGASSERADFQDFSIVKALDKASPKLSLACADGTHISEVVLELCRAGGQKLKYMEYKLTDCIVSSSRTGGSSQGGETLPLQEISFNYGKIEWTYTQQQRAGGGGGGNVAAGWNLETNTKV